MNINQIVYNLEDYAGSGGLYTNLPDGVTNFYDNNLLEGFGSIQKLGIQAPPGTKFILNKNKDNPSSGQEIMVGRTGIYELEEDVIVTSLSFPQPKLYKLNEETTKEALKAGLEGIKNAKETFDNAVFELNMYSSEDYMIYYQKAHDDYVMAYQEALNLYLQGINGKYDSDGEKDLHNIIIDFIGEKTINNISNGETGG